jgi:hypothetical protein
MKTSILISSFAALCLMVTFAELPSRLSNDTYNLTINTEKTNIPANLINVTTVKGASAAPVKSTGNDLSAAEAEDFSYLKFDVADYASDDLDLEANNMTTVEATDNSFEYLKFDVTSYTSNTESAYSETMELPLADLDYLKFDVSDYISTDETASPESFELPVNEFEYLKFDVTDYIDNNTSDSYETIELPVNEFEYLKFDVNKFYNTNENNAEVSMELPETETITAM